MIVAFGLILALVFGLVAFTEVVDLQVNIVGLTGGGLESLAALLPTLWFMLIGVAAIALVVAAVRLR